MSERPLTMPPSDTGGRVVDDLLFRFLVDLEVQKAQRLRYSFSIICLAIGPVLGVGTAPGVGAVPGEPGEGLPGSFAEIASHHIRATDVVAPWTSAALALLLVDAETIHLPPILRRLTSLLGPVAWSAGGSCFPKTATRADDMLRQATDSMVRARNEGGNRIYVAS